MKRKRPSFQSHNARKEHECIWCAKTIPIGAKYFSKPDNCKMVDELLEKETGWNIYTIKRRTRLYFVDRISWKFCSLECLANFSNHTWEDLPFNVRGRMGPIIVKLVNKVKDIVKLMTSLEGQNEDLDQCGGLITSVFYP